jgi:hypothetical protein
MSARAFGAFRTSLGGVNFLETRSWPSSTYAGFNSTVDSSNNIYLTGLGGTSVRNIPIEKINSTAYERLGIDLKGIRPENKAILEKNPAFLRNH